MTQRMTDKKRFKKALRLIQQVLRDNIHGANDPANRVSALMRDLDATLDAIRVPGEEPEEEHPDGPDLSDHH